MVVGEGWVSEPFPGATVSSAERPWCYYIAWEAMRSSHFAGSVNCEGYSVAGQCTPPHPLAPTTHAHTLFLFCFVLERRREVTALREVCLVPGKTYIETF